MNLHLDRSVMFCCRFWCRTVAWWFAGYLLAVWWAAASSNKCSV